MKKLLFLFALLYFCACQKDDRLMYQDDPSVYFYKINRLNQDSLNFSFAFMAPEVVKDTVYVKLRITGDSLNYDREVNLFATDSSTAKEGVDFNFGPKIIHANKFQDSIPIYLIKTSKLDTGRIVIKLKIGESKDFKPGYVDNGYDLTSAGSRVSYTVTVTNTLSKPAIWDNSLAGSFGIYSKVKFQLMISLSGITDWTSAPYPATSTYLVQLMKSYLLLYKIENGHALLDENGKEVTLP